MLGALGEGSDSTVREAWTTGDEWGVKQGMSWAESVDLMPAAADAGKGHSSQPQSISKA